MVKVNFGRYEEILIHIILIDRRSELIDYAVNNRWTFIMVFLLLELVHAKKEYPSQKKKKSLQKNEHSETY